MSGDPDAMWRPGFEPDDTDVTTSLPAVDEPPRQRADAEPATPPTAPPTAPTTAPTNTPSRASAATVTATPLGTHGDLDHVEIVLDAPAPTAPPSPAADTAPSHRRRRAPITIAVVVLLAVAAVAAIRGGSTEGEQVEPDPVAGADDRRVAETADRLWGTTIGLSNGVVGDQPLRLTQFYVADRSTVVALLPADDDTSIAVGLDALTGAEQWRSPFDFGATAASILGVLADTAVLEQNDLGGRRLIGVDIATGATVWELPTRDNGVHVVLSGTDVITRVSFTGNARLTFIDPATGDEVFRASGRLIGTDLAGTWYVEDGRRISAIDLSNGAGPVTEIAERADGWGGPTAIVDGRIIVLDDDGTLAEAPVADGPLAPLVATGGDLPDIASLVAIGGSSFLAIGEGKVLGISLVDDNAQIGWSIDASVRVVNVTDRGMLVAVSDATLGFSDGAELTVLEPLTGERLANTGPAPGTEDLPRIVGNGFVITNPGQLGTERVGLDLDGTELWRLAGGDPIQFGDRVMVTVNTGPAGYAFSGFGDSD